MENLISAKCLKVKYAVPSILALCLLLGAISSCRLNKDPGEVASAFLRSMMSNDIKTAKEMVSSERWSQIDAWISTHQPISCSSREWDTGISSVGSYRADTDTWNFGLLFHCADAENRYCFSIDNVVLQRATSGWQVIEWGNICEEQGYCDTCP